MPKPCNSFHGETSAFDSCRPQLEACLVGQGKPDRRAQDVMDRVGAPARWSFGVPLLLIAVLAGWWIYSVRDGAPLVELRPSA